MRFCKQNSRSGLVPYWRKDTDPLNIIENEYLITNHYYQKVKLKLSCPSPSSEQTPRWLLGVELNTPVQFELAALLTSIYCPHLLFTVECLGIIICKYYKATNYTHSNAPGCCWSPSFSGPLPLPLKTFGFSLQSIVYSVFFT